jgi:thioester reductase-like protein
LTGASGFLGAHILASLLEQNTNNDNDDDDNTLSIVCFVRGDEPSQRLASVLKKYSLNDDNYNNVDVVQADLNAPRFGLEQQHFDQLCNDVTIVIHCAAIVVSPQTNSGFTVLKKTCSIVDRIGCYHMLN